MGTGTPLAGTAGTAGKENGTRMARRPYRVPLHGAHPFDPCKESS